MTLQRIAVTLAVGAGLLGLWRFAYPTPSYRYRLTIEIEKNGVIHSGSSVIELNTTRNRLLAGIDNVPEWETHPRGEAVFVDLGDGENLIALLEDKDGGARATAMLPSRVVLGDEVAMKGPAGVLDVLATVYPDRLALAKGKSFPVRLDQLPPTIRLRRVDDPSSVAAVDVSNLAASYGPEVMFRSASLQITADPVTKVIASRLPWLGAFKPDKALNGRKGVLWQAGETPYSTPSQIAYWNFSMEGAP